MRQRNRAVMFTEAGAEATETSAGEPTVTVRGTWEQDNHSQTNTLHLSHAAAWALYRDLKEVLAL